MTGTRNHADYVLAAAERLVAAPQATQRLRGLAVASRAKFTGGWTWMEMPGWAGDLVPAGRSGFFVPEQQNADDWARYDWWAGAAALLNCDAEREREREHGPLHSYSFRLDPAMRPAFDHAWVNRIVLFLRRWWSHENGVAEHTAFGPLPPAILHLTHDVDAVSKTIAIRGKQTAFSLYNRRFGLAARFMLGPADYWQFDTITGLEARYGRRSTWNFYGGRGGLMRSPKELLMDPAYRIGSHRLSRQIRAMKADGHRIGLHPRFDTWRDAARMRVEKTAIEDALGQDITDIRQHWLRFSFADTWKTQRAAGLVHDYTLGFNDRVGFRSSSALTYADAESGMRLTPLVLMDSHLHDYSTMNEDRRFAMIDAVLNELVATGGEASVVWHQRVFHPDYAWGSTYEYLLNGLKTRRLPAPEGF